MKYILSTLVFLLLVIGCEKSYNDQVEEQGIKIIYDTVHICPDDPVDSLIVVNARLDRTNSRSCFYLYRLPIIVNDGSGPATVINSPIKFNWDCDWEQTQFIDFTNIGDKIILSPDKPRLFGDVAYRVNFVGDYYIHPLGWAEIDRIGTDSLIIAVDNPKVNAPSIFIKHVDDWVGNVGDFLEITPKN
jgi:hypothetical protein